MFARAARLLVLPLLLAACATRAAPPEVKAAAPAAPPESPAQDANVPPKVPEAPEIPPPETAPVPLVIDRLPEDFPQGGEAREAAEIDLIVIHTIGGPECRKGEVYFTPANGTAAFWRDWFLDEGGKSIHYVVGRDGDIAQQRPELRTAGHVSFGGIVQQVNRRSIGIELVNRGDGIEPFPEAQIGALKALVADIAARYAMPPEAVVTHAALDDRMQADCGGVPLRRNLDPGPLFPLEEVRAAIPPV